MTADYYALLQVEPGATSEEIHKAYRTLALRHHPDRNSIPGTESAMAAINEAYSILGEPMRRRKYDQARTKSRARSMAAPILKAARESVLKHRWPILQDDGLNLVLERGSTRIHVIFADYLDNALLRTITQRATSFTVVLAVEIERPINLGFQVALIDLMRSEHSGAIFPDELSKGPFAAFL
jgi:hypothetical protein